MARETKNEAVLRVWSWILDEFPVRRDARLEIRRIPKEGNYWLHGYAETEPGKIVVVLDERLTRCGLIETLWHEWAHIKSRSFACNPHTPKFNQYMSDIEGAYWRWPDHPKG